FRKRRILLFLIVVGIVLLIFHSRSNSNNELIPMDYLYSVKHSGNFCVIYDYWRADKEYLEGPHITLLLHATSNYVTYLEKQLSTWDGGLSVTLYIPTPIKYINNTVNIQDNQIYLRSIFSALSAP